MERERQRRQLKAFLERCGVIIISSDKSVEWFWNKRGSAFMTDEDEVFKLHRPDFLIDTPWNKDRVIIGEVDEREHCKQTGEDAIRDMCMHRRSGHNTVTIRLAVDPSVDLPLHHMREFYSIVRYYQEVYALDNVVHFLHYNTKKMKEILFYHKAFIFQVSVRTNDRPQDLLMLVVNFFNTCLIDVIPDDYSYIPQDILHAFARWGCAKYPDIFSKISEESIRTTFDKLSLFNIVVQNGRTYGVRMRHDLIVHDLPLEVIDSEMHRFDQIEQKYYIDL